MSKYWIYFERSQIIKLSPADLITDLISGKTVRVNQAQRDWAMQIALKVSRKIKGSKGVVTYGFACPEGCTISIWKP